jgi:hypothetical protein
VTIAGILMATILVLALWVPAESDAARNVFAALYGVSSAALLSIVPNLAAHVCTDVKRVGSYTGLTCLAMSPGLLITLPAGGALVGDRHPDSSPYLSMKLFCGFAMGVGGLFFVIARGLHVRANTHSLAGELPRIDVRFILL